MMIERNVLPATASNDKQDHLKKGDPSHIALPRKPSARSPAIPMNEENIAHDDKARRRGPKFWRPYPPLDSNDISKDVSFGTSKSLSTKPAISAQSKLSPSPSASSFGGFRHWRSPKHRTDFTSDAVPSSPQRFPSPTPPSPTSSSTSAPSFPQGSYHQKINEQVNVLQDAVENNNISLALSALQEINTITDEHALNTLIDPINELKFILEGDTREKRVMDDSIRVLSKACCVAYPSPVCIVSQPSGYVIEPAGVESFPPLPSMEAAQHAKWFRLYFAGKFYTTLVAHDASQSVIVSVAPEITSTSPNEESGYRIIVRSSGKRVKTDHHHVSAKALLAATQQKQASDSRRRSLIPNNQGHRLAVKVACPHLDLKPFREMTAEASMLVGLEKELLRFDEMVMPKNFKFGVLSMQKNQKTEEEWFSNTGLTPALKSFLTTIGTEVKLKGYKGYAAGLDTRAGESGQVSFASRWKTHPIMFHVAPLIPSRPNDKQQVHRKRHIGNDIVCIVFAEGSEKFDPTAIRSQFLHVYLVVRPEGDNGYRIEVVRSGNVKAFGPPLPYPSIIAKENVKDFILSKLVHAEYAALESEKFAIPNAKARAGLLNDLAERCLQASSKTKQRPRSTGAPRSTLVTENAPPVPTPSRSTMLRDLTSLARRRRSSTALNSHVGPDDAPQPTPSFSTIVGNGIRTRAQSLVTSVMQRGRPVPTMRTSISPSPAGPEHRTRPFP